MIVEYIPRKTYAVAAAYRDDDVAAAVAGAVIRDDGYVNLKFPRGNPYRAGQGITLHLDNRTGVETFDSDLRVYRCSYRGAVVESGAETALVAPLDYQVVYSTRVVESFASPAFGDPAEARPPVELAETPLGSLELPDEKEHHNKLGVLVTRAAEHPRTTLMAFLSTAADDIFLITQRGSRKAENLRRDPRCCFAIDHRSTFLFEKAYEWNFTIVKGRAYRISPDNPLFGPIQATFVEKNPWETAFFSDPTIEMYHIAPEELICPDKLVHKI